MSLEDTDAASAAVQKTPNRVSLRQLEEIGTDVRCFTLGRALEALGMVPTKGSHAFTICAITTRAGFTVIGKTAPADPANFDADVGRKFAYEDALRQLWPLEGYLLRNKLAQDEKAE